MPKPKIKDLYTQSSNLAPCIYPAESAEDLEILEGVLRKHVASSYETKWPRALNWIRNIAFLNGNQYPQFIWDGQSLGLGDENVRIEMPGDTDYEIPKTVDNKIIRPHETNVSMLTSRKPVPRVVPASTSPEDEDMARVAEVIFNLKWEEMRMPRKLRTAGSFISPCGLVMIEIKYGSTGTPIEVEKPVVRKLENFIDTEEEPEYSPELSEEMIWVYNEDLVCNVWSAFEFTPDAGATEDPDSWSWFFTEEFRDVGAIKEEFDIDEEGYLRDRVKDIGPANGRQSPLYWYERIKDLVEDPEDASQFRSRFADAEGGSAPNQCILRTWTCKPNMHFPRGRTIVTADSTIIYVGDARAWDEKYPERWHSFSRMPFWEVPGSFWGVPLISKLVPPQRRINAIDSLVQLNREMMTIGQWLVPRQAKVQDGVLSGIPASIIKYNPVMNGAKPERVTHQPLPSELLAERAMLVQSIDLIAGINQIESGQNPSGVRSGVMQQFMHQKTLESKNTVIEGISEAIENIGQQILIECSINMTEEDTTFFERIKVAARENSALSVQQFSQVDLRDNTHIRIDIASDLRKSPEAEEQKAIEFLQYSGGQMSPEGLVRVAKKIGFDEFDPGDSPHVDRAKRLISRIIAGEAEDISPMPGIENAMIFKTVFENELLSARADEYEPDVYQGLIQGWTIYSKIFANEQAQQMKQQMEMAAQMAAINGGGGTQQ